MALRSEYITYILVALDDAGRVMNAVAHGVDTDTALANKVSIPKDRRAAAIRLLTAIGYLKISDQRYSAGKEKPSAGIKRAEGRASKSRRKEVPRATALEDKHGAIANKQQGENEELDQ